MCMQINSSYDLVDPLGMFETQMRLMESGFIGNPIHEEITETAISQLQSFYPKLYQYGFRYNNWDGGPTLISGVVWCRIYNSASVAKRLGRHLQPDPVSDLNLYMHANNSPYDAVDPLGMFETQMRTGTVFASGPIHEEIKETAISQLQSFYPKLYKYGFRYNNWDSGPPLVSGLVWCRTYDSASVANGANVADCRFSNDSSYHCDNSNFSGCYGKAQMLTDPVKSNLVKCACYSDGGGGGG